MIRQNLSVQRVLRIGIVHEGKIIKELLVPPGTSLSVGTSPRCTVTLPALVGVPEQVTPFHCHRGRYTLRLPHAASVKLARDGQVQHLQIADVRLPLEDNDRGRVELGGLTILFQMIEAPPVPATRRQGSFRPRLIDEDDPMFLGILSLCSAAAASLMIYASSLPPAPLMEAEALPEYMARIQLSAPPPAEVPAVEPEAAADAPARPSEPEPEPEAVAESTRVPPAEEPGLSVEERELRRAQEIQQRKNSLNETSALLGGIDQLIRTRGESGSSVFQGEDSLSEDIGRAMEGVGRGSSVAIGSPEGGILRGPRGEGGRTDARLDGLSTGPTAQAQVEKAPTPATPRSAAAKPGALKTSAPEFRDAVRKGVRSVQIQTCYERSLKENPSLSGRLVLDFSIIEGQVEDIHFSENTTGSRDLEACVERYVQSWTFTDVAEAEISLPYILTPAE